MPAIDHFELDPESQHEWKKWLGSDSPRRHFRPDVVHFDGCLCETHTHIQLIYQCAVVLEGLRCVDDRLAQAFGNPGLLEEQFRDDLIALRAQCCPFLVIRQSQTSAIPLTVYARFFAAIGTAVNSFSFCALMRSAVLEKCT